MTPAEIALARMLIAWDEWPGGTWEPTQEQKTIETALLDFGDLPAVSEFTTEEGTLSASGAALVARYREQMAAKGEPL